MKKLLSLFFFLQSFLAIGQYKYLVVFKDKLNSPYSVDRPQEFLSSRSVERRIRQKIDIIEQDLPVNPQYLSELADLDVPVEYTSRWLNAALINIPAERLEEILALSFVEGLEGDYEFGLANPTGISSAQKSGFESLDGFSLLDAGPAQNQLEMLGADIMHEKGYKGKGVLIGLLDSGFSNADNMDVFASAFAENRIIETFNFVFKNEEVYNAHYHGTHVLSCVGANLEGQMLGTAPEASFALYITEDVRSETRMEEANWLFGAERADSLGVDIIGSSLGYSNFDGTEQDYTYEDLDGNTALVTRAANWATSKGIVVVLSAGNEGNKLWEYITPPADAYQVIAVAAVDEDEQHVSFSSIGPTFDGRVKPEVAAKGLGTTIASPSNEIRSGNGTSYAAPLISGLAAGLIQAFPQLSAIEIRDILLKSGSQAQQPDHLIGYGIPNFERAFDMASLQQLINSTEEDIIVFPNPSEDGQQLKVLVTKEELGSSFKVTLTSMTGATIYQDEFKRSFFEIPFPNENLAAGIYILRVWNDKFNATSKVYIN